MSIVCQLCQKEFKSKIDTRHLISEHHITTLEYKEQFGKDSITSPEYRKSLSGRIPHNKGKKVTDDTILKNIRDAIKQRDERYEKEGHPLVGQVLSDERKHNISTGLKDFAAKNPGEVTKSRAKTRQTKLDRGILHKSYNSGPPSAETIQKLKDAWVKKRSDILAKKITKWIPMLSEITLIDVADGVASLLCSSCNHQFTYTTQYLHNSKFRVDMCPLCRGPVVHSLAELEILEFVRSSLPGRKVYCGNRSTIKSQKGSPLELDIFIPDLSLAIEYCGIYWHSERKGKGEDYHAYKHIECEKKNIQLVTIFEDEWINNPSLVKSRILTQLDSAPNRIGARKCVFSAVDQETSDAFCNKNHTEGSGLTDHAYGLYYNNELVSIMTFTNIADDEYELTRFCSIQNTVVQGSVSKLFNHFVKLMNPKIVTTYSDKRWNTGDVYETLGFTFASYIEPKFWYISYNMLKTTENTAVQKNKIWDCGHDSWIWVRE